MPFYPVNLQLAGRRCIVVGGGTVAERKVMPLLNARADVTVISPQLTPRLAQLAEARRIIHIARLYKSGDLQGAFLVICATDSSIVNEQAAEEAQQMSALLNVVDNAELGNFSVPAQVTSGDLLITVSTGGKTPVMARRIREELARTYGPEYGLFIDLLGRLRSEMKAQLATSKDRENFWRKSIDQEILELIRQGKTKEAEDRVKNAVSSIGIES
ncbi:MAG: bifunctional precorrin-2 dehydrogenase/sirohydrochlorin ferrochelatase [Veillonellaceae bacterium]|jgi:precorrin-2 dehydrogenase/sirohydrochlorin ferrochelatase|nr:bifunctional precorrin-2 dehydrogenase/sirohydrochlorin ferrochelatase [Veillonellaceae bacterium]